MSHIVIYEIDGSDSFERFVAIDEAIALVERLRNEGNGTARLYRLEEIPLEIKAYYRVEVGGSSAPAVQVPHEPAWEDRIETLEPAIEPGAIESGAIEPEPMDVESTRGEDSDEPTPAGIGDDDEFAVTSSLGGARRGLFGR